MAAAPVGDDVYGEDPTINALERRVADLLGHEAGLFCGSGSLANLLGVRLLVEPGEEVVCDVQAHIARAEMGAHAARARAHHADRSRPSGAGWTSPRWPRSSRRTPGPTWSRPRRWRWRTPTTSAAARSKTTDQLAAVGRLCREHGVGYHLDGARLWNAHVATGVALADYGRLFDTVSVCFSKGLGAPVGSMLVSTAERIARARVLAQAARRRDAAGRDPGRRRGVRAGPPPGSGWPMIMPRPAASPRPWRSAARRRWTLDAVETNIVIVDTGERPAAEIAAAAAAQDVRVSALGPADDPRGDPPRRRRRAVRTRRARGGPAAGRLSRGAAAKLSRPHRAGCRCGRASARPPRGRRAVRRMACGRRRIPTRR